MERLPRFWATLRPLPPAPWVIPLDYEAQRVVDDFDVGPLRSRLGALAALKGNFRVELAYPAVTAPFRVADMSGELQLRVGPGCTLIPPIWPVNQLALKP